MNISNLAKKKIEKRLAVSMIVISFFVGVGAVYALSSYDSGWRVNKNGETVDVVVGSATGDCYKVTNNNTSNDYFVPTKTAEEWNAFDAYKPGDVLVSTCSVPDFCEGKNDTTSCGTGLYCDGAGECRCHYESGYYWEAGWADFNYAYVMYDGVSIKCWVNTAAEISMHGITCQNNTPSPLPTSYSDYSRGGFIYSDIPLDLDYSDPAYYEAHYFTVCH